MGEITSEFEFLDSHDKEISIEEANKIYRKILESKLNKQLTLDDWLNSKGDSNED